MTAKRTVAVSGASRIISAAVVPEHPGLQHRYAGTQALCEACGGSADAPTRRAANKGTAVNIAR